MLPMVNKLFGDICLVESLFGDLFGDIFLVESLFGDICLVESLFGDICSVKVCLVICFVTFCCGLFGQSESSQSWTLQHRISGQAWRTHPGLLQKPYQKQSNKMSASRSMGTFQSCCKKKGTDLETFLGSLGADHEISNKDVTTIKKLKKALEEKLDRMDDR